MEKIRTGILSVILLLMAGFIIGQYNPARAQGYIFCNADGANPAAPCGLFMNDCDPGYQMPCTDGDCCTLYYMQHGTCPTYPAGLQCIPETTGTPTNPPPAPNPSGVAGCPGPYPYCDADSDCNAGQVCSAYTGGPTGCTGYCRSTTLMPTANPTAGGGGGGGPGGGGGASQPADWPILCDGNNGVNTALGCISADQPEGFLGIILSLAAGIAGGIAFLLILVGGFQIMTSSGNPEQMNAGRELVSSALIGLLLILFSVFILKLIGVNILGIPNFS